MMPLIESFQILKKLPIAKYKTVDSESELDFPFPFWLKSDISGHKTEEKAVLKCRNEKEASANFQFLKKKFSSRIIMQESVEGIEMIIGMKSDRVFSRLLMIGFGGIHVEAEKDVSFRALPVNKKEISEMISELKMFPALISRKKYALDRLVELAEKISLLQVSELDLNPVILNEKEAVIVDARIQP